MNLSEAKSAEQSVDIIMVTYHTGEVLFESVNSILGLELLDRIIIVDNGNSEDVLNRLTELSKKHPRIKLISGHGNIGFSKACNLGAKNSSAKYLLFLNPDCIAGDKKTLVKFTDSLSSGEYKVATCVILNEDGSIQKTCRRNLMTSFNAISESFNLYKISKIFTPINLPIEEIKALPDISPVPALSGAVVFTTSSYYRQIEGFSEDYFLHVEDMDLSMKIHLHGNKIAFIKNIRIKHLLSTSKTTIKFLEKNKAQGFITYIQKYFPLFRGRILGGIMKGLIWVRCVINSWVKK
jgi:hypothetical protein